MAKFEHYLSAGKVRQMCINNDYYTRGDCQAYENMFNMFMDEEDVTPELIKKVAQDIKDHSETEDSACDIMRNLINLITLNIVLDEE